MFIGENSLTHTDTVKEFIVLDEVLNEKCQLISQCLLFLLVTCLNMSILNSKLAKFSSQVQSIVRKRDLLARCIGIVKLL